MAKYPKHKFSLLPVTVAFLIVLLAVLALLQYRSLGRVSAGERDEMRANLEAKTRSFCQDFDREISRAYSVLRLNSDLFRSENRNSGYAEKFARWVETSPHSGIVKSVFLVEAEGEDEQRDGKGGSDRRLRLLRYDPTAKAFEQNGEWPPELENLRHSFEQQQNSDSKTKPVFTGGADSVVEEIPALVSSIVKFKATDLKSGLRIADWQHPSGYIIVILDLDYIRRDFFPALAQNYFAAANYDFAVMSRAEPSRIIYESNPESNVTKNSLADATGKLLSIRYGKVKSYSSDRVFESEKSSSRDNSSFTLVVPAIKDEKENDAAGMVLVNDTAPWEIKVTHRLGSLDAAIADAKRWNLAANFGVLLLLGVSITMIATLSRRSQNLARRQMDFVAGVSHEFRTPLAVIHSLSENLAAGRINKAAQVRRYGATIHKDVRRLTEMVEQVLEFAGAERGGKHFYDKNPLDIGNTVEKILAANFTQLKSEGWLVEMKIEADLPFVLADETALKRAVQNLISNSMKYSDGNHWLKIAAYQSADKQQVNISVEDKGIGISEDELRYIFEPFYRGREAASSQIHGNGIGLSLVRQIIEAHGGRISVKSNPGKDKPGGSIFTLHLPIITE